MNNCQLHRERLICLLRFTSVFGILMLLQLSAQAQENPWLYQINFGPGGSDPGFVNDGGEVYGPKMLKEQTIKYGWVAPGTATSKNASANAKVRSAEELLDRERTLIILNNANNVSLHSDWLMELPAGDYRVTVGAGDPLTTNNRHHIVEVNGTVVVDLDARNTGITNQEDTATIRVGEDRLLRVAAGAGSINSCITYIQIAPALDVPTDLKAVAASDRSITLSWTDGSDKEGGYEVEQSEDGQSFNTVATLDANTTQYVVGGLASGKSYDFRIRTVANAVRSPPSEVVQATPYQIQLTPNTVSEDQSNIDIGTLSWPGDNSNTVRFTVVDRVDGSFGSDIITVAQDGRTLRLVRAFDYETYGRSDYRIIFTVRATREEAELAVQKMYVTLTDDLSDNILLSNAEVPENQADVVIGSLSWTDDPDNSVRFAVIDGVEGSFGNNVITVAEDGTTLKLVQAFDYEDYIEKRTDGRIIFTVRASEGDTELNTQRLYVTLIDDPNEISLSNDRVRENLANHPIGTLSWGGNQTVSYALAKETQYFQLQGNELLTKQAIDYEAIGHGNKVVFLDIEVRANGSLLTTQQVVIYVEDDPNEISLSNGNIAEYQPIGTEVGTLSYGDGDDSVAFATVKEENDQWVTDERVFRVEGNKLVTTQVIDYAQIPSSNKKIAVYISVIQEGAFQEPQLFRIQVVERRRTVVDHRVIVELGQSNMVGVGQEGDPSVCVGDYALFYNAYDDRDVIDGNYNRFVPLCTDRGGASYSNHAPFFAQKFHELSGDRKFVMVEAARGGSGLTPRSNPEYNWSAAGNLRGEAERLTSGALDLIEAQTGQKSAPLAALWDQGGSDAFKMAEGNYSRCEVKEATQEVVNWWQRLYPGVPFIISGQGTTARGGVETGSPVTDEVENPLRKGKQDADGNFLVTTAEYQAQMDVLREIHREVAVENNGVYVIEFGAENFTVRGGTRVDDVHYSGEGYKIMGEALAQKLHEVLASPPPPTTFLLSTPTNLAATASSSVVTLSWNDICGDQGYEVERSTGNGSFQRIAVTARNTTGYQDTELLTGTYSYRVRAIDTDRGVVSQYTEVVSIAVGQTPSPPGEPLAFAPQWGGNVAAMVWSTFHYAQTGGRPPVYQQAYTYDYDPASRLTEARYASHDTDGGWGANQSNYSVKNIGYDANGNITGLTRYTADPVDGTPVRRLMDQLSYSYAGNRLQTVSDAADAELGFADGASSGNEYGYDANGNLTRDDNKGITNVEYDPVLDVPLRVDFADGAHIEYGYDAAGNRLSQTTVAPDGTTRTTDYLGAVEYRDDQLALIHQPEGRVIPQSNAETGGSFVYHYDLRDHLGNVRLTFSEEPMVVSTNATMEASAAPTEEAQFEHLAASRRVLTYHNTTPASEAEANPNKVATLLPGQTGPAKSLSVRAGDRVHLKVNAAYETGGGKVQGLEGTATQLAGALERSAGTIESGGLSNGLNGASASSALANGKDPKVPNAYLNYLVYDTDYRLVDQGFVAVSEAAAVAVGQVDNDPAETLALDVDIEQNGYLYAYLSNESRQGSSAAARTAATGVPVNFDDLSVEHEGISIVQHNDYYAFGATYQQSANRILNNAYLYQGKELQDGFGLELYDFHARQYDPLLGRFTSLDPMNQFASGYVGMGNNPVNMVDPDGQFAHLIAGAMIGSVAGYGIGYASGLRGNELLASTFGGLALGVGIAAGIETGFFGGSGPSLNLPGALDANIGYAESIFQGVKPFVDGGLNLLRPGIGGAEAPWVVEVLPSYTGLVNNLGQEYVDWPFQENPGTGRAEPVVVEDMMFGGGGSLLRFGVKTLTKGTAKVTARGAPKLLSQLTQTSIDDFLRSANQLDRNGLTKAGRALQKHGSRPGSTFPKATGNPASINAQGESVLQNILHHPNKTVVTRHHARFGNVIDIRLSGGQGARFSKKGNVFLHFLEP